MLFAGVLFSLPLFKASGAGWWFVLRSRLTMVLFSFAGCCTRQCRGPVCASLNAGAGLYFDGCFFILIIYHRTYAATVFLVVALQSAFFAVVHNRVSSPFGVDAYTLADVRWWFFFFPKRIRFTRRQTNPDSAASVYSCDFVVPVHLARQ
jgi:hypothetical protein